MTSPRDDRFYDNIPKSRRSPSGADSAFFGTGQGGRTVLPPLSSAFPTSRSPVPSHTYPNQQYMTSRTSPGRSEHPSMYGNQWSNAAPTQQHGSNFYNDNYDTRYATQQHYGYPSRASPALPGDSTSRKLPPLSASPSGDRWQSGGVSGGAYSSVPAQMQTYSEAQATNFPLNYSYHQQPQYGYPVPQQQQIPMNVYNAERGMPGQVETHGPSPYARSLPAAHDVPAASSEEPAIKKKRKRADATQLKVLNEVYARTAFPSTEERAELARKLDMSARSVQIWFQNKRQSMRQTSRQSSSTMPSGSHQSFSLPSPHEEPRAAVGPYGTTGQSGLSNQTYMRGAADSRAIPSGQTIKRRSEEADARKWAGHY